MLLVVCLCIIWIPLKRSRLGLSIYAIGSSELAAFRSGVPVARTRIIAYALSGLFAAMGGLALTMSTGIGAPIPGPYLLASVAAVVLGGVALGGGKGGLLGPIVAVFVLRLVRTDLTLLAIDPNVTAIIEGAIMVAVVMFGAFITMRSRNHEQWEQRQHRAPVATMTPAPIFARPPPQALHGRPAADPADHPARHPGGDPADPAPRHRQRTLARQHRQVRHTAGHPRRLPDHDHADRRHRPVGRHGGDDERLHHGDAGRQSGPGGGHSCWR